MSEQGRKEGLSPFTPEAGRGLSLCGVGDSCSVAPMKFFVLRLILVCGLALPLLRAAGTAPYLGDPGNLLPLDPPARTALEGKLARFERTSGVKIIVRLQAKSPSAEEDKVAGAYMRAMAGRLDVAARGVLAVYFADEDDWRVWIGDELTPVFVGRPGTAKEFTESGAMHEAKEAFLKATFAQADAAFAARQKSTPASQPLIRARKLGLQADALVDGLIGRLTKKE